LLRLSAAESEVDDIKKALEHNHYIFFQDALQFNVTAGFEQLKIIG